MAVQSRSPEFTEAKRLVEEAIKNGKIKVSYDESGLLRGTVLVHFAAIRDEERRPLEVSNGEFTGVIVAESAVDNKKFDPEITSALNAYATTLLSTLGK
jgi:hypothetical protein